MIHKTYSCQKDGKHLDNATLVYIIINATCSKINPGNLINIYSLLLRMNGKTRKKKCVNKERVINLTFLGLIDNKDHDLGSAFGKLKYIVSYDVR